MNGNRGYFDHNATTPMSAAARAAWLEASDRHWHNPSGLYRESGEARRILEDWRAALADHFGIDEPERIVFTSGATEANNAVIRHLAESVAGLLVTSEIEHPCGRGGGESPRAISAGPATADGPCDGIC